MEKTNQLLIQGPIQWFRWGIWGIATIRCKELWIRGGAELSDGGTERCKESTITAEDDKRVCVSKEKFEKAGYEHENTAAEEVCSAIGKMVSVQRFMNLSTQPRPRRP